MLTSKEEYDMLAARMVKPMRLSFEPSMRLVDMVVQQVNITGTTLHHFVSLRLRANTADA